MSLDLSNYELLWSTSLFVSEGERVLRSSSTAWENQAIWLLTEALVGTTAVADFEDLPNHAAPSDDPWGTTTPGWGKRGGVDQRTWFTELVSRAAELRQAVERRPYWPQRQGCGLSHDDSTPQDTRPVFARIGSGFADNGYLVEVFGEECVDDPNDLPDASEVIDQRLGIPGLWPPAPETWHEGTFFGLIEVFHDLVSRPRTRRFHNWNMCGWHHSEFHNGPARTLYRDKVNGQEQDRADASGSAGRHLPGSRGRLGGRRGVPGARAVRRDRRQHDVSGAGVSRRQAGHDHGRVRGVRRAHWGLLRARKARSASQAGPGGRAEPVNGWPTVDGSRCQAGEDPWYRPLVRN
ncbi:hypothetical protein ACFTTN_28610 [Streptomyces niveus]|uniref:hypothetical protein n=1 Tax=Streptomyces niveus TaxID=193462 RepID=UPI00362CBCE3